MKRQLFDLYPILIRSYNLLKRKLEYFLVPSYTSIIFHMVISRYYNLNRKNISWNVCCISINCWQPVPEIVNKNRSGEGWRFINRLFHLIDFFLIEYSTSAKSAVMTFSNQLTSLCRAEGKVFPIFEIDDMILSDAVWRVMPYVKCHFSLFVLCGDCLSEWFSVKDSIWIIL